VPTLAQPTPSCSFKSGKVILQQPVEPEQMSKLLATGKTDLLDKFVSMRTRRSFKAFLAWDAAAGKVNFEFEARDSKYPPRKTAGARPAGKTAAKAPAKKASAKKAAAPRKSAAGKAPSAALAAVIGAEAVSRPEAMKKIWAYIKERNLQDPADKRRINADAALATVFGKPQDGMFEIAGLLGPHFQD
jgi:DNA topoisomerase-3